MIKPLRPQPLRSSAWSNCDEAPTLRELTAQLSVSLRKPTKLTLRLIDKALSYLLPFESPLARTTSPSERADLLDLLTTHRLHLSPYIDVDRIEFNLRYGGRSSCPRADITPRFYL